MELRRELLREFRAPPRSVWDQRGNTSDIIPTHSLSFPFIGALYEHSDKSELRLSFLGDTAPSAAVAYKG